MPGRKSPFDRRWFRRRQQRPGLMSANRGGQSNAGGEVGQTEARTPTRKPRKPINRTTPATRAPGRTGAHAKHEVTSQVEVRIAAGDQTGADKINIRSVPPTWVVSRFAWKCLGMAASPRW